MTATPRLVTRTAALLTFLLAAACILLLAPGRAHAAYTPSVWTVALDYNGGAGTGDSRLVEINSDTGAVMGTPIDIGAASLASALAISPDGSTAYVARYVRNDVVAVNLDTHVVTPLPGLTASQYVDLVVAPDGGTLYLLAANGAVSSYDVASATHLPSPVSVGTLSDPLLMNPLAISSDGSELYVTDENADTLEVVSTATMTIDRTMSLAAHGTMYYGIALNPDGTRGYVTARTATNQQNVINVPLGGGSASGPYVSSTDLPFVMPVTMSPDDRMFVNSGVGMGGPYLVQIGEFSGGMLQVDEDVPVTGSNMATSIAVTPDARRLLHADVNTASIVLRDMDASGFPTVIATQPLPAPVDTITGMAAVPNQPPTAALAAVPNRVVGQPAVFDASASTDDDAIGSYDWDFGDGTTLANGGATPNHAYSAPGSYTVTLTTSDPQGCSTNVIATGRTVYCNGGAGAVTTRTVTVGKRTSDLTVSCTPPAIQLGEQAVCTGTVTDTSPAPTVRPTGTITFSISGPGTLSAGSCQLPATGASECSVTLTASPNTGGTTTLSASYSGDATYLGTGSVSGGGLVTVPSATGVKTSIRGLITMPPGRVITVPCSLDNTTLKRCTAVLRDSKGRIMARASRTVEVGDSRTTLRLKLTKHARTQLLGTFPGIRMRLTVTATQQFGAPTLTTRATTKLRPKVALVRQHRTGQFIGDSAWAKDSAKRWAKRTAKQLRGARRVVCNGYTAGTLNSRFARRLARARALEMCLLLKRYGMKAPFTLRARGNAKPVASNRTERGRILNRRVELSVYR